MGSSCLPFFVHFSFLNMHLNQKLARLIAVSKCTIYTDFFFLTCMGCSRTYLFVYFTLGMILKIICISSLICVNLHLWKYPVHLDYIYIYTLIPFSTQIPSSKTFAPLCMLSQFLSHAFFISRTESRCQALKI